jgi:hypothetical protein
MTDGLYSSFHAEGYIGLDGTENEYFSTLIILITDIHMWFFSARIFNVAGSVSISSPEQSFKTFHIPDVSPEHSAAI